MLIALLLVASAAVETVMADAAVTMATPPAAGAVNTPAVAVVNDALAPEILTLDTEYRVIPGGSVIENAVSVLAELKLTEDLYSRMPEFAVAELQPKKLLPHMMSVEVGLISAAPVKSTAEFPVTTLFPPTLLRLMALAAVPLPLKKFPPIFILSLVM